MRLARRRPWFRALPAAPRPARRRATALETGLDVLGRIGLSLAIVAGGAVAATLLLLLLSIASPVAAVLVAWIVWRTGRDAGSAADRLRARWGRSAHVVTGGLDVRR